MAQIRSQRSESRAAPRFGDDLAASLRAILTGLFGGYRPERHYMRGPGPKWHEKHGVS